MTDLNTAHKEDVSLGYITTSCKNGVKTLLHIIISIISTDEDPRGYGLKALR